MTSNSRLGTAFPRAEMNLFPPKRTSRSAKDGHDHVIVRISSSIIAIHPEPLGVIMRSFIQIGVVIAACGSAIFWFTSAMCRLPSIKPGTDELDTVTELSKSLQFFWSTHGYVEVPKEAVRNRVDPAVHGKLLTACPSVENEDI